MFNPRGRYHKKTDRDVWILVSLGVFRAMYEYCMPSRSRLGFHEERRAVFFDDYVFIWIIIEIIACHI